MDSFEREAHKAGKVCQGGCRCRYCRNNATSSAGQRRKARVKAASRRVARARLNRNLPTD